MVADVARKFDSIGDAARAKARILIGWADSFPFFGVPPEVKVRCACKDGADSINQGDGLAMNTEEWRHQHNGFYAISILGHPGSGDGAARQANERYVISEPGRDVEPDGCLVEKVLSGLQTLEVIHAVSESGIAGARHYDVSSGCMEDARQRNELLRAICEAVEEYEDAFGFVSLGEQATASLWAERES
jgi:hypothetical protein